MVLQVTKDTLHVPLPTVETAAIFTKTLSDRYPERKLENKVVMV